MIIAYWIVGGLVAALALAAGVMKLARSRAQVVAMGQGWADDVTTVQFKLIGVAEVVGAVGIVVPMATGILPVLSPLAALGIAVVQVGAFVVHSRRGDPVAVRAVNMAIFALAGATAVLGFLVLAG